MSASEGGSNGSQPSLDGGGYFLVRAQAPWPQRLEMLQALSYRFGIYAALNFIDEPAWLAVEKRLWALLRDDAAEAARELA